MRQIFDAIDIVMRWRTDQRNSRLGMPQTGDELGDLVAGKLATLTGLGALRDLDLQLFRVGEIFGCHAESDRRQPA